MIHLKTYESYGLIKLTDNAIEEINKYGTSEQFLRSGGLSDRELYRSAFGFYVDDIKTLSPEQIHIKWKDDIENVKYEQIKSGLSKKEWAKKIDLSKPVDIIYEKDKFYLDDGHHRYYAAKILGKDLNINLQFRMNPIKKLSPNYYDYDQFHRQIFTLYKRL